VIPGWFRSCSKFVRTCGETRVERLDKVAKIDKILKVVGIDQSNDL